MERYITTKNLFGNKTTQRMVNQPEIVNYLKQNPGKTENEIMFEIYGFDRNNTFHSNKKYAECLRRALRKGSIGRVQTRTTKGKRYIYFCII